MAVNDYAPHYQAAGERYNVDPMLLRALAQVESDENPNIPDSSAGAQGPMQIMPKTQQGLGMKPGDAKDYSLAVHAGADLMDRNLKQYGGDVGKAVLAYHGGTDEKNWGPKTRDYLRKVTEKYQTIRGGSKPEEEDDAFSAAFAGKTVPKPEENDPFSHAFTAQPKPAAPVSGPPTDAPKPSAQPSAAIEAGAPETSRMDRLVREEFKEPLGPSDKFLDAIGLNAGGPSGILRAPARGALTVGDAAMRAGNVLMKGTAGAAGDVGEIAAHVAPGLFHAEPATVGRQLERDVYGMGVQAGASPVGVHVPEVPPRSPTAVALARATDEAMPQVGNRLIPQGVEPPMEAPAASAAPEAAAPSLPAPGVSAGPQTANPAPAATNALQAPMRAAEEAPAAAEPEMTLPKEFKPRKTPVVTEAAADREANRIIQHFASDGPKAVDTAAGLTGEHRTLAQATGNAGLAALERSAQAVNPNAFTAKAATRGEARANHLQEVTGTAADIDALEATRDASTARSREAAFKDAQPVSPSPVVKAIDDALASPEGQRDAVRTALTGIRNKLIQVDPATGAQTLQTDPAQLYGVRKAIGDAISPKAAGTAGDARLAAHELIDVQRELDKVIEGGAPGYKGYMKSFAEQSKPIEALHYLQGLKMTDANGHITLQKVDNAIKGIEKQRNLPGPRAAKSISEEQFNKLMQLRDDLRIEGHSALGKGIGSDTVQKLATNSKVQYLSGVNLAGVPLLGLEGLMHSPGVAMTAGAAKLGLSKLSARGNELVYQKLMNKLLNPEEGARALQE